MEKIKANYSIASKQSYSIRELAKLFKNKIKYLPKRSKGVLCVRFNKNEFK
jgi:hypothetical protein